MSVNKKNSENNTKKNTVKETSKKRKASDLQATITALEEKVNFIIFFSTSYHLNYKF